MKLFTCFVLVLSFTTSANANDWHDMIMKMQSSERKAAMGNAVRSRGHTCTEKKVFFQGFDGEKTSVWNVACANGKDYVVSIEDNKDGTTRIADCSSVKELSSGNTQCWIKFK